MKQWKTSINVAVFSIVALAGLVMLALITLSRYTHQTVVSFQPEVLRLGELNFAVGRFEVRFLQARRAEKDYLLRLDEQYVERHGEAIADLKSELDDIELGLAQLNEMEGVTEQVSNLRGVVVDYQKTFGALVSKKVFLGVDENSGLQGKLRQAVRGVEAVLRASNQHQLTAKMLMMRRHEKDFIQRLDDQYVAALNARIEEFYRFPSYYYQSIAQQAEIIRLLSIYQETFEQFAQESLKERDLRVVLSQEFAAAEPYLDAINTRILTRLREVLANAEAEGEFIQELSMLAGFGGLLVFVAISFWVARAISYPLGQINSSLLEMVQGDFSRKLPRSRITELAAISGAVSDFRKARDKALAGERAKARLFTVMSHEMRTPLNGVLGSMELLETTEITQEQKSYLQAMRVSAELLLYHVNEVLELSGLESDFSESRSRKFDLEDLMSKLINSQNGNARARGNVLTLNCRLDGSSGVSGRPTQVQKVMLNIIGNALKFTKNGSVTVDVSRKGTGKMVEFLVKDDGVGIAPDDLKRIFDDFVTLDTDYARTSEGTGLGLSITRRIVEGLGGVIGAESVLGKGTQFRVILPLPKVVIEPETGTGAAEETATAKHLLIVEDNDINRVLLEKTLQKLGHNVTAAPGGAEAIEAARKDQFDLILMDISMPGIDGIEARRRIKEQNLADGVNIIALTAHAAEQDRQRILDAGFQEVVTKPISRGELAQLIARYTGAKD